MILNIEFCFLGLVILSKDWVDELIFILFYS